MSVYLLTGKSIGHNICYVWLDGGVFQLFRIEKMKGNNYVLLHIGRRMNHMMMQHILTCL